MTPDEVIAANVKRIRKERDLTVIEMAKTLGVGRNLVYDLEGPRKGADQRAFLWTDLVRLCVFLDITIFDLVVPHEKSERTKTIEEWAQRNGVDPGAARGSVLEAVFGFSEGQLREIRTGRFKEHTRAQFKQLVNELHAAMQSLEDQ